MKDKLVSLQEAARTVPDGALLGLTTCSVGHGGLMAFLRELVRQGTSALRVATLSGGGLDIDLLIGAAAVAEYETCACSLGEYGPAPNFQRAIRDGSIVLKDST